MFSFYFLIQNFLPFSIIIFPSFSLLIILIFPNNYNDIQVNQMLIYSPTENIKPTNTGPSGEALPQVNIN
jgi:hypothetical protein